MFSLGWCIAGGQGSRGGGRAPGPAARTRAAAVVGVAVAGLLAATGCASTQKPRKACIRYEASPNLNFHDGQAHVVQVSLFPLASTAGFEKASIEDLLGGAPLTGAVTGPVQITVAPGDADKKFEDHFPGTTAQIGVVANFYRAPDDPEGERRQVVPAKCGLFPPTLTFTAHNMLLK